MKLVNSAATISAFYERLFSIFQIGPPSPFQSLASGIQSGISLALMQSA